MKTKLSLVIASLLAMPVITLANDVEELPTIIVEGTGDRPGTFATAPDSSGLKDTASLLKNIPGANVNRSGPLTGIAQY
ncbi:MAG: TonB-dependent receptor, partial [Methylococcaceae bacterium]|nr:TonB-dependent receptor [Methylococcaceae bacterium]